MRSKRDQLLNDLAEEEACLVAFEREYQAAQTRVALLRERLARQDEPASGATPEAGQIQTADPPSRSAAAVGGVPPRADNPPASLEPGSPAPPRTAREKVHLFRSLFHGREDVFPTRFVSAKTGKAGYTPACGNKFVRGVCQLPRVKCGACPNQAFLSVTDEAVLDHLRGRHVIGVYPLLQNESCWFLAADFDGEQWRDDIVAFRETCCASGVPVAIERSRSGNGAHAWFFFDSPVPASEARKMGCYLLTETMARRHQLGMASYDRLFPNQDTMPHGGFGNLIALPLQYEPRQQQNTVFLDEALEPYADQWAFLASIRPMAASTVEALATEAAQTGRVLAVRPAEPEDEETTPWLRPPSGRPKPAVIEGPLPAEVRAVLRQRLFVEKKGLPSALLNQIKRVAAFQNPEFYKKQSMRLSTALTPRVIACAEEFPDHIALPRGCGEEVKALLDEVGIALVVDDQREDGASLDFCFHGHLTALQADAAHAMLAHEIGVVVAPPGAGKTVLGANLIAERGRSTLVLVHRQPLLDQWVVQMSSFLALDSGAIGRIGGGKRTPNGRLDVAMIQSLVRKGVVDDVVAGYGHVIVDECHHVPAVSFERVMSEVRARYVTGLTATPQRRDGHHPILELQVGPVRYTASPRPRNEAGSLRRELVVRETPFRLATTAELGIQEIYAALAADTARNELILDDVIQAVADGRSPILLTERRDHLEYLAKRLRGFVRHVIVLHGGTSVRKRRELAAAVAAIPDDEERLLLATGRYIGEGFDDARLDTLFLALPVSWKGTLVQYAGRLNREHEGKRNVSVFDYVDRDVPVLRRMFERRLRGYRAIGFNVREHECAAASPAEQRTIVYDSGALSSLD